MRFEINSSYIHYRLPPVIQWYNALVDVFFLWYIMIPVIFPVVQEITDAFNDMLEPYE